MKRFFAPIMIIMMLYFGSCQVKIPSEDSTNPTTEIRIVQDKKVIGTYQTGNDQLVLPIDPNKVYDILVDGKDEGGVESISSTVKGKKVTAGPNQISFGRNEARDRRILAQVLDRTRFGDFITIKSIVKDYGGRADSTSAPQVILTVGQIAPVVKLSISKNRLVEGDTFRLSWTSQKAKELKFIAPNGNNINIPKEKYAKGSVLLTASRSNTRYVLQATSHTGQTRQDVKTLVVDRKRLCRLVRKSNYNVSVIETLNGREKVHSQEGTNGFSGNTNLGYKLTVAKVQTSTDKKRGYAQMLRQRTTTATNNTIATYTDYFDFYDLTKCTGPYRTIKFILEKEPGATRGSIGKQKITKKNKLLIQWVLGYRNTSSTTNIQEHGISIVDMNSNTKSSRPEGNYGLGQGSLLITKDGTYFLNSSHSKVAVIYQKANRGFYVRRIDLSTFKIIGQDVLLSGFTGIISAKVDAQNKLKVNGSFNRGGTRDQVIDLK